MKVTRYSRSTGPLSCRNSPENDGTLNFVPLTRHPTILDLSILNIAHIASKFSESSFNIRP